MLEDFFRIYGLAFPSNQLGILASGRKPPFTLFGIEFTAETNSLAAAGIFSFFAAAEICSASFLATMRAKLRTNIIVLLFLPLIGVELIAQGLGVALPKVYSAA